MPQTFSWPLRVYYADTDAGGVVYHANYLNYMERARNEWLRVLGHPVTKVLEEHGLQFVLRSVKLDFQAPARLDDALDITAEVISTTKSTMTLRQQVLRDEQVLVEAELIMLVVESTGFRPQRLPAFLLEVANADLANADLASAPETSNE